VREVLGLLSDDTWKRVNNGEISLLDLPTELTDDRLMRELAHGDQSALGELFQRHGAMIKGALRRFAPEMARADVDELAQDVFLALYDSAPRYTEQAKFKSWIYSIAVHKSRTWRRKTWLRRNLLDRALGQHVAVALPCQTLPDTRIEMRAQIENVLGRLTPGQREVVLLHLVDGFTGVEIAHILNVKAGVVWSRLHRARLAIAAASQVTVVDPAYEGEI
jgi:RNA polymerase sigma-70 factor (ECF subfamily)